MSQLIMLYCLLLVQSYLLALEASSCCSLTFSRWHASRHAQIRREAAAQAAAQAAALEADRQRAAAEAAKYERKQKQLEVRRALLGRSYANCTAGRLWSCS